MSAHKDRLRKYIREVVEEELDEMTTTGNVAGYNIPAAFSGNDDKNTAKKRAVSTQLGYQMTKRGEEDMARGADALHEEKMRYHEYKKDESASPHKKIARAISELNRNLQEVDRALSMNTRLQTESGIASEALWKRTQAGLIKLEAKLVRLASKVRNIRGR